MSAASVLTRRRGGRRWHWTDVVTWAWLLAGVVLMFHLTLRTTGRMAVSVLAAVMLVFSSGYWLNANMETKCYTLFFWMATFVLGLSYRGEGFGRLALLGASGAVATLCQADGVVLIPVALFLVAIRHRDNWRRALGRSLFVLAIWAAVGAAVVGLVGSQMPSFRQCSRSVVAL